MRRVFSCVTLLLMLGLLGACSGGDNSAQQTQISTLQTKLAAVQTQLSSAQAQGQVYDTGINTAITSLTQTQSSLAQLAAQPASAAKTIPLTTASNQVLVLQSLADSLTSTTATVSTAYANSQSSLASLTTQQAALQAQVATLTAENNAATTTNATQATQIASLNAQITTLTGQIAILNTAAASQADTITALNSTITNLNATIATMVAKPIAMSVSALTATVSTTITVTATFPASEAGKTATFSTSAASGSLTSTSVTIASDGTATTTFSSATTGTYNIYAVEGLYCGGVVVTVTATPATTYSISGTVSLGGTGLQNVLVALTGASTAATITAADGTYTITGVPNGSYTITPSLSGFSFAPSSIGVTVSGANATGKNLTAYLPAAEEVKLVYDQVNNDVNYLCSADVNTGATATYSYVAGTLSVNVTATSGTVFPLRVVYTLTNFVSGSYTVSGTTTAIVTAPDYWTSTGTLTAIGGDISTIGVAMARNGNPTVMTGLLIVNGYYIYDYATGAYY